MMIPFQFARKAAPGRRRNGGRRGSVGLLPQIDPFGLKSDSLVWRGAKKLYRAPPPTAYKPTTGARRPRRDATEGDMPNDTAARYSRIKAAIADDVAALPAHARIASRSDLVKRFGVSRTTVDHAISELIGEGVLYARDGSGTYVAEREEGLGRNGGLRSWGVLVPDIRHYNYPGIVRGIEHVGFEHGVNVIVGNSENRVARQTGYLRNFIQSRVDGIIIVPARPDPSEDVEDQLAAKLRQMRENGIPFVFCNRSPLGVTAPQVVVNDFHGGFLATRHLIEQGYRRIAYLAHPRYAISLNRYMGYASALTSAGIGIDESRVAFSPSWDFEAPGHDEMARMLAGADAPDAAVCFTDWIAKGAYRAVCERGLTPGRDIGIVGYDDSDLCRSLDVPLSSVRVHPHEMGRRAAQLVLEIGADWEKNRDRSVVLMPDLAVRGSSLRG